ncbi:hypothetical protein AB5J72_41575 [Streptomyces sp. CG1]|uniref:hypothetical protein n=1 Tax=Streptomyces sp. CG1 TaxID=1287523 RepID=UPI0034E2E28F
MPSHTSTFSAVGWVAANHGGGEQMPGVWRKELLNSSSQGDSFSLLRLAAGGEGTLAGAADDRVLVPDGRLSIAATDTGIVADHRSGAYAALPGDAVVSSADGALALDPVRTIMNGAR